MDTTYILIIAVVLVLAILAGILAPIFARRRRTENYQNQFGAEYDRTVASAGSDKEAQTQLDGRRARVKAMNIRELSAAERERYLADWDVVQAKFVDQPGQATIEADHLIMEVMQLRDYPVSDFEQRAADLSVQYPELVGNYRAARETAIRNEQHHAGTEDLRRALIYYRSLFDELLKAQTTAPERK